MSNQANLSRFLGLLAKKLVKPLHLFAVSERRISQLSHHLSSALPQEIKLRGLDVGCGSGELAKKIEEICPHIEMSGVDVLVRDQTAIQVVEFDGIKLPFEDKSYDFIMLIDVLHHTDYPQTLIEECVRVSRSFILIKDHICESWWDRARLRFMDWVGNRSYDVYLPYNYLSSHNWQKLYYATELKCEFKLVNLGLYAYPFSVFFDSTLHFIARLAILRVEPNDQA
jgi:SAM-dependent methyltransferase